MRQIGVKIGIHRFGDHHLVLQFAVLDLLYPVQKKRLTHKSKVTEPKFDLIISIQNSLKDMVPMMLAG
ncbi:hypothetical protein BLK93_21155 [Klebsiella pneumoniae]|nr:hypothetical protein BLK93_21155 [Klebsiella pneumoniae]